VKSSKIEEVDGRIPSLSCMHERGPQVGIVFLKREMRVRARSKNDPTMDRTDQKYDPTVDQKYDLTMDQLRSKK
jgi:hypothetical protein